MGAELSVELKLGQSVEIKFSLMPRNFEEPL